PHHDDADAVSFGVAAPDGLQKHFRGRVPVTRTGRVFHANGQVSSSPLPPVHLSAAGQDEPAHAAEPGCLHHVINADEVVGQKLGREIVVVGCGRQMNQSSYSVGGSVQSFWFGDVANHAIVQARCLDYIESTNR